MFFTSTVTAMLVFDHPVWLLLCFICAVAYSVKLLGRKAVGLLGILIPLAVAFAVYYSSYHHFGVTVLRVNPIGNVITLESLVYGFVVGFKVAGACLWFSCIHKIFTTDKIVYLFGVVSPKLNLFLSVMLRLVPRIKRQAKRIHTAQKGIGRGIGQGNIFRRLRNGLRIFSMLITWLIESVVTLSDSMASRGSRCRGRTAFSIYRFDTRDRAFLLGMIALLTLAGMGVLLEQTCMQYDPRLVLPVVTPMSWVFWSGFAMLCAMPLILDVCTDLRFRKAGRKL